MKLSDWAKKQGISYLTAYRWFKDGKLPIKAYQSDSGTIIVQDESETSENVMANSATPNQTNDIMSLILKKTVEFSKNNASVEDFAAYILSNFSLKPNNVLDHPKYSRNKPKAEEIQKHFQQFLKPKGEKPKPNNVLLAEDAPDEVDSDESIKEELTKAARAIVMPEVQGLFKDLTAAFDPDKTASKILMDAGADSIVNRIESTPQSINYTDSINTISSLPSSFDGYRTLSLDSALVSSTLSSAVDYTGGFKPTQKEIESAAKAMEKVATDLHTQVVKARRGRKPSKNGKK